jgi:hypothetical protein
VYKKVDTIGNSNDPIRNFLGTVADHPDVLGSKLTDAEKNELDRELVIQEFDKSVRAVKQSTAPGVDGISNRYITHFWPYFRNPLLKYTVPCYA